MSTTDTTNKTSFKPLERMKVPAPIKRNDLEMSLEEPLGFFSPDKPIAEGFSANGSIDNFNPETAKAFYKAFEGDDNSKTNPDLSPVTELFQNGAEVTFGALQKSVGVLGGVFEAVVDVVKDDIAFEIPKEQNPVDQQKQHDVMKKEAEYAENRQKVENINNKITSVGNEKKAERNLDEERQRLNDLLGYQANFKNVISENTGKVAVYLEDPVERALELRNKRAMALKSPIQSASKKGGQGVEGANKANETSGGNTNAQNAVG